MNIKLLHIIFKGGNFLGAFPSAFRSPQHSVCFNFFLIFKIFFQQYDLKTAKGLQCCNSHQLFSDLSSWSSKLFYCSSSNIVVCLTLVTSCLLASHQILSVGERWSLFALSATVTNMSLYKIPCEESLLLSSWVKRRKGGSAWITTNQVAITWTSELVNLFLSCQTGFFDCKHPLIGKPIVITELAVASAWFIRPGFETIMILATCHACSTKILLNSYRVFPKNLWREEKE